MKATLSVEAWQVACLTMYVVVATSFRNHARWCKLTRTRKSFAKLFEAGLTTWQWEQPTQWGSWEPGSTLLPRKFAKPTVFGFGLQNYFLDWLSVVLRLQNKHATKENQNARILSWGACASKILSGFYWPVSGRTELLNFLRHWSLGKLVWDVFRDCSRDYSVQIKFQRQRDDKNKNCIFDKEGHLEAERKIVPKRCSS